MPIGEILGLKILFIAGITNIIFLLLVLFSCRCIGVWRITKSLMGHEWYMKFFSYHCYYWYGFFISVLVHTTLAFYIFGIPF